VSRRFRGPERSDSGPPPSETDAAITSYAIHRSGFSVRVDGGFVDDTTWLIHGIVAFRPHPARDASRDVETAARRQLVLAIGRESRMARDLGARAIYVFLEGDREIAGFYQMLVPQAIRGAPRVDRRCAL